MANRRCLICPLLLLAIAPGCQALHLYRPVSVQALDAETKQPIPGAEVRIWYPLTRPSSAPYDSTGTTGSDGVAHLRAAAYGDVGIQINVAANGYMSEIKNVSVEAVHAIEMAHLFENTDKRPVSFALELYADPHPTVELVVPMGYRGMVQAEVKVQPDVPHPAGQRCFRFDVPPTGNVQVIGPTLLERIGSVDFHIKYADGTPLSGEVMGPDIGFWCVKFEGNVYRFLIGTRNDYDAMRPSSNTADVKPGHADKGAGQGRHGRKGGNQQPADPGP